MMSRLSAFALVLAGSGLVVASSPVAAQGRVQCESRNGQYQHCAVGPGVDSVRLVRQISGAACVEGSSWGWDRRGVWVNRGCAAVFEVSDYRPPSRPPGRPGGDVVNCGSRDHAYQFCTTDQRVISAALVRQISRAPCVLGRTWGWRGNGVWVNDGCEGDFRIDTDYRPGPSGGQRPGLTLCESHEYRYNFCRTGPITGAQMVEQRSQAPCVQGRSWGWRGDGVWVDNGCEALFRVRTR